VFRSSVEFARGEGIGPDTPGHIGGRIQSSASGAQLKAQLRPSRRGRRKFHLQHTIWRQFIGARLWKMIDSFQGGFEELRPEVSAQGLVHSLLHLAMAGPDHRPDPRIEVTAMLACEDQHRGW